MSIEFQPSFLEEVFALRKRIFLAQAPKQNRISTASDFNRKNILEPAYHFSQMFSKQVFLTKIINLVSFYLFCLQKLRNFGRKKLSYIANN